MEWFLKVVRDNYANFNGRARRQEYWMFILFYVLIGIVTSIIDSIIGIRVFANYGLLNLIFSLALFAPSLAVGVRRLHDIGKSGWWILLGLIPIIGQIWLIILLATDSVPGDNQYGPNPKGINL